MEAYCIDEYYSCHYYYSGNTIRGFGCVGNGRWSVATAVLRYFFFVCDIRKKHRWALISPNGEAQM